MATEQPHIAGTKLDLRQLEYIAYDANLSCSICRCPYIDPVSLPCDHTYCRDCLSKALLDRKTCPTCRQPTSSCDARPTPRIFMNVISDLLVKCPNEKCEIQLRRGDVQTHVDGYCDSSLVRCAECGREGVRRAGKCPHADGKSEDEDRAMDETKVEDLEDAEIPCAAASIGCHFVGEHETMQTHIKNCALAAILPSIKAMERRLNNQGAALEVLQRKNSLLESSIYNLQAVADDVMPGVSAAAADSPPFDSTAHHLLSLYESMREELDRVSAGLTDLEGRSNMMLMNETLRIREEMAFANGAIGSLRTQMQWLMSARLQAQSRLPVQGLPSVLDARPQPQPRRLSDPTRQDTKL